MEPIYKRQTLGITLLRGADRRYRAFIEMESANGYVLGRDMLKGKGTTDPFASWQRLLYHNADILKWWDILPQLAPDLDQLKDESYGDWIKRLVATRNATMIALRDHSGRAVETATTTNALEEFRHGTSERR